MIGAGIGHIWQIISANNMAVNNAGPVLWIDILMPLILAGLYVLYVHEEKHESHPSLR
jgi:hypothetical protein